MNEIPNMSEIEIKMWLEFKKDGQERFELTEEEANEWATERMFILKCMTSC